MGPRPSQRTAIPPYLEDAVLGVVLCLTLAVIATLLEHLLPLVGGAVFALLLGIAARSLPS